MSVMTSSIGVEVAVARFLEIEFPQGSLIAPNDLPCIFRHRSRVVCTRASTCTSMGAQQ